MTRNWHPPPCSQRTKQDTPTATIILPYLLSPIGDHPKDSGPTLFLHVLPTITHIAEDVGQTEGPHTPTVQTDVVY